MRAMKRELFIYVDFDSKAIGFKENNLEWEPGDKTNVKGKNVYVYALISVTEEGLEALRYKFHDMFVTANGETFAERVNDITEKVIALVSNDKTVKNVLDEKAYRARLADEARARKEEQFADFLDRVGGIGGLMDMVFAGI